MIDDTGQSIGVLEDTMPLSKRFVIETAFFGLGIPLAAVFAALGAVWGSITVLTRPFGSSRSFAYGPWRDVGAVFTLVWRHVRYLRRFVYRPWRQRHTAEGERLRHERGEARKRAVQQLAALRGERGRERRRALLAGSAFEALDAGWQGPRFSDTLSHFIPLIICWIKRPSGPLFCL